MLAIGLCAGFVLGIASVGFLIVWLGSEAQANAPRLRPVRGYLTRVKS
jgi:hypothetical protein